MNPVSVSVIVPAYNASATIGRALEALSQQDCFQPYEVIVVDDGSTDNTAEIVKQFSPSLTLPARGREYIKYVRQENAGPAAARNHGAKVAQGEYFAFTDSDCIPHKDWISKLMAGFTMQAKGIQIPFGALCPHLPKPVHNIAVVAGSYGIANPESRLGRCICVEILWRHRHLMPDFPKSFGSYNFCVKKEVFEAVGGFNTAYRSASGEDNDLSYKITQSGWRIYFERKALVDHYHPTRVLKYLKEQFRHGFWRVRMYQDHPRMMRGDGYTFWKDIIEMPLALSCLVAWFLWLPFLMFEIFFALLMTYCFFDGIFSVLFFFCAPLRACLVYRRGFCLWWRKN